MSDDVRFYVLCAACIVQSIGAIATIVRINGLRAPPRETETVIWPPIDHDWSLDDESETSTEANKRAGSVVVSARSPAEARP